MAKKTEGKIYSLELEYPRSYIYESAEVIEMRNKKGVKKRKYKPPYKKK